MLFKSYLLFAVLQLTALFATIQLRAQGLAERLVDLNPGPSGSFPSNFTTFNGALYFSAYNFELGRELWKYDGAGITLVSNINPTSYDSGGGVLAGNDSAPDWFIAFNGSVYFTAYDQRRGGELWRYDGARATRVADINPDLNDTIKPLPKSSWPYEPVVFNNTLYFGADGGSGVAGIFPNYELWKFNGTTVSLVTNIHSDFGTNFSSYPTRFKVFNNALYFTADDGVNGYELWKHNGTTTVLLTNINPGGVGSGSYPNYFTVFNNALYFEAYNDARGFELWKTDGTATTLVADINPFGSSYPESLIVFGNALYFRASDGISGSELWKFDGTNAVLAADIDPFWDSSPKNFTVFQNQLYFSADDGIHGWELWRFDGTSAALAADVNPSGDSFPEALIVWNNRLWFVATNEAFGYEVWQFDGQTVTLAADINPGSMSSYPQFPVGYGSSLLFSANDSPFYDWEPWAIRPSSLRITDVQHLGTDIRIFWSATGGTTNFLQASGNLPGGFINISPALSIRGVGDVQTNFLLQNAAQSSTSRFFRVMQP